MKPRPVTLHYCARCRMTTPHELAGDAYACRRCATAVKAVDRLKTGRPESGRFETGSGAGLCGKWN